MNGKFEEVIDKPSAAEQPVRTVLRLVPREQRRPRPMPGGPVMRQDQRVQPNNANRSGWDNDDDPGPSAA